MNLLESPRKVRLNDLSGCGAHAARFLLSARALPLFVSAALVISAQSELCAQIKFSDGDGDLFMEETTPSRPPEKPPMKMTEEALKNVGVSVDPSGRIVPLINKNGSFVQQQGSKIEASNELIYTPQPWYYPGVAPWGARSYWGGAMSPWVSFSSPWGGFVSPWGAWTYPSFGWGSPYGSLVAQPGLPGAYPPGAGGINLNIRLGKTGAINLGSGSAPYLVNPLYASPLYTRSFQTSPFYARPPYASPFYANPFYANPFYGNPFSASSTRQWQNTIISPWF